MRIRDSELPPTGIERLDREHAQLATLVGAARGWAAQGDVRRSRESMIHALRLLERHVGHEEEILIQAGSDRVLELRRAHEALLVSLEELCDEAGRHGGVWLLRRLEPVSGFMEACFVREAEALRRVGRDAA